MDSEPDRSIVGAPQPGCAGHAGGRADSGASAQTQADPEIARLVVAARDGDADAFGALVERHYQAARRVALAALVNAGDADEAVQEACLTAWRRIRALDDPAAFRSWLLRITWHKSLDRRRSLAGPAEQAAPAQESEQAGTEADVAPRAVNVHLEFTITDAMGDETPRKKVVSMIAADQSFSRVRATAFAAIGNNMIDVQLNVDARPTVLEDGRVRVEMTLEHTPPAAGEVSQGPSRPTYLTESVRVILTSGQPLMVSQAADPNANRRVTVEVTATIIE